MFSVATILILAALIVCSLSASGLILLKLRAVEAPAVEAPSVAEVKTFLEKSETSYDGNEAGPDASFSDEGLSPLESLVRTHGLSRLVAPLIDRISEDLTGDEFNAMLAGLDDLLPRIPAGSRDKAAVYFCQQFCDRCEAYDNDLASDSLSNAGTYALSITFLTATLYFFFALMAFIAFPLLIKIERNTKLLAEAA
ncbi:hypothetical protein KOR34_37470 [Posidoniimonas corsicana]|uniref:Uncharacterized protein n=1 Tax=Posidoniimonas corsicana TaxID=1938618 RepID=A0A5C5V6M0_9BACT|nr:hypothetical protein [Posidoniimonas corsicana]TWT33911.1 hypothetical protein KOR34_37470 [Posidoniimonas corsicana]